MSSTGFGTKESIRRSVHPTHLNFMEHNETLLDSARTINLTKIKKNQNICAKIQYEDQTT